MEEVFWGKHLKSTAPLLQLMDSKCTQSLGKILCKCSDSKQKPVRSTYRCCCFSCSGSRSRWQTVGEVLHPIEEPFLYTKLKTKLDLYSLHITYLQTVFEQNWAKEKTIIVWTKIFQRDLLWPWCSTYRLGFKITAYP